MVYWQQESINYKQEIIKSISPRAYGLRAMASIELQPLLPHCHYIWAIIAKRVAGVVLNTTGPYMHVTTTPVVPRTTVLRVMVINAASWCGSHILTLSYGKHCNKRSSCCFIPWFHCFGYIYSVTRHLQTNIWGNVSPQKLDLQ